MFDFFSFSCIAKVDLRDFSVTQNCQHPNEWSTWYSTPVDSDGNDFETLHKHREKNSVCASPFYIEAREKMSKVDWLGSNSTLIHMTEQNETVTKWAYGFSNKFG